MMTTQDIRWVQRLNQFSKALGQLRKFIKKGALNEFEEPGFIHAFENTYELAWSALKDFFEGQGETNLYGSRDVFPMAFSRGLIVDGETWMDMIKSRTLTSHRYNEDVARQIADAIVTRYFSEFVTLQANMQSLKEENP